MLDLETRTRHKAGRLPQGEAVLALLTSPRMRKTLVRAAGEGEIPVASVAPELVASFASATKDLQIRQLVGLGVRMVLAEAGFIVENPRRRFPGAAPFRYGATFRLPDKSEGPGLVERLVDSLTVAEATAAHRLLSKRLGLS